MYLCSVQDTSFTDLSLMYDSVHEAIHCSYYVIKNRSSWFRLFCCISSTRFVTKIIIKPYSHSKQPNLTEGDGQLSILHSKAAKTSRPAGGWITCIQNCSAAQKSKAGTFCQLSPFTCFRCLPGTLGSLLLRWRWCLSRYALLLVMEPSSGTSARKSSHRRSVLGLETLLNGGDQRRLPQ